MERIKNFMNLKYTIFKIYWNTPQNNKDFTFVNGGLFFIDLLFYIGCFNFIYMLFLSQKDTVFYFSFTSAIIIQIVYFIFPGYQYLQHVEQMKKSKFYLYFFFFIILSVAVCFTSVILMNNFMGMKGDLF